MITYMGLLTVPLIVAGAIGGRPRLLVSYWTVVAVVSFGLVYQFPVIIWLRALPVLNVGAGVRFLLSWSIAAAVLAGFGVELVLRSQRRAQIVVGLAGLLVVALLGASVLDAVQAAQGSWFFGTLGPIALRKIADFYNRNNPQILGLLAVAGLGAMLLVCLGLSGRYINIRQPALLGLLGVTVADLLFHGVPYNSFAAPEAIYPLVPATKALQQGAPPSRFMSLDRIMYGNTSMTQGIHNVLGEQQNWYAQYYL
jgi:hypothetical protein